MNRETYIPTEQSRSQTPPRLPVAHGIKKRSESSGSPPRERPQESFGLSPKVPPAKNETHLNRVERLRVRREFLFVAQGHSERRRSVVIQARKRPSPDHQSAPDSEEPNSSSDNYTRVGFTATKKIGGAVIRNRAKRRLRECARALLPEHSLENVDYVFIARRDTASRQWSGLLDDVESALVSLRQKILSGKPPAPFTKRPSTKRSK